MPKTIVCPKGNCKNATYRLRYNCGDGNGGTSQIAVPFRYCEKHGVLSDEECE